jgi:hypothetical protein
MVRLMIRKMLVVSVSATAALVACVEPPSLNIIAPAGVVKGMVLYSGPVPCTESGHVVGNANLLLFDTRLLPPPDGLGTRSSRLAVVQGDVLFHDLLSTIYFDPSGARYCPPAGLPNVTVSSAFELGPVDPSVYQMRAFYDYDGDFHPSFRFSNLPTLGDVAGGAISNATAALAGAKPVYSQLTIGEPTKADVDADVELKKRCATWTLADGTRYCVKPEGQVLENVSVALALPLPTQRPFFHVAQLQPPAATPDGAKPAAIENPDKVSLAADFHVANASPLVVQEFTYSMRLTAGVKADEKTSAEAKPFSLSLSKPGVLLTQSYDSNRDGVIDAKDTIIGSSLARALWPLVSFAKLEPKDPYRRTTQDKPRLIASAVTTYNIDPTLDGRLTSLIGRNVATPEPRSSITAVIRPTIICIPDAADPRGPTTVVTPYENDQVGQPTVGEFDKTIDDVAVQLGRARDGVRILYACLPPGSFSVNVIYPLTGQAWTLPNESGLCLAGEALGGDGKTCGLRPKLASQGTFFEIAPAGDISYCAGRKEALAKQSDGAGSPYASAAERYRATCLNDDEKGRFDAGTLWTP